MSETKGVWHDDHLGFEARGNAFTNLIKSITDHRTISIEAGYGHGKTFFRERWAKQLRAAGECVVEIDARLSDHSGDPVVAFLGALLQLVPEEQPKVFEQAVSKSKNILMSGGKIVAKAALREGFEELAGAFQAEEGEASLVGDIAKAAGQEMSKAAGALIATQFTAEKARKELAEQLQLLKAEITRGMDTDRIVILIDELDRCHPDYAIALLEAMKLVFDQDGFVFVLMVNREYLENVAAHRFGVLEDGESYLDKFVDLRLKLEPEENSISSAVEMLAENFKLVNKFGEHEEFSIERARRLAGQMAAQSGLSMRQIKRTLERIELTLLIYKDRPIDAALIVWLAFKEVGFKRSRETPEDLYARLSKEFLPRANVTPELAKARSELLGKGTRLNDSQHNASLREEEILREFPEVLKISDEVCQVPNDQKDYFAWARIYNFLAPHYIPDHQAMLDAVHKLQVNP